MYMLQLVQYLAKNAFNLYRIIPKLFCVENKLLKFTIIWSIHTIANEAVEANSDQNRRCICNVKQQPINHQVPRHVLSLSWGTKYECKQVRFS